MDTSVFNKLWFILLVVFTVQTQSLRDTQEFTPVSISDRSCEKPVITQFSRDVKHEIGSGPHPKLRCKATGYPKPRISWSPSKAEKRFIDNNHGVFTIKNPIPTDAGNYTCTASNQCGTDSVTTYLTIEYPENPIAPFPVIERRCIVPAITKFSGHKIYRIGSSMATLECKATGFPKPTTTWSPIRDARQSIDQATGTLSINNPQPEDAGVYICTAYNKCGNTSIKAKLVIEDTKGPCKKPTITRFSGQVILEIGSRRSKLRCRATGHPKPTISWSPIKDKDRFVDDKGTLIIKNLRSEDAGVYTCTASNKCGENSVVTELVTVV